MLHTHLYGFHVLFPCTVVHEPPYQTYSSVWCAGFRRRFPRMNDRTDSTLVWGSLRLAPTRLLTHFIKKIVYLFNKCVKMAKELYVADTLVSVKYNKTLKTLPLCLYESIQLLMRVL